MIQQARPDARLALVGSNPSAEVLALAGERVQVTGSISSEALTARYRGARVAIVPLRFGAGVKLKVVEAMREGVPLVTTGVGAQGLPGLEDVASVRETPEDLAQEALRWLDASDYAWLEASHRQVAYAEAKFGRAAMREPLERAIASARTKAARARDAASVS